MKKLFALIAVFGMLLFVASNSVVAQDQPAATTTTVDSTAAAAPAEAVATDAVEEAAAQAEKGQSLHSALKQKFIEGGPGFMTSILLCLILGLAFAIERVIYLNMATSNTKKLLSKIEDALNNGGIEWKCAATPVAQWPVSSIRVWTVRMKALMWLKNRLFLMVAYRQVFWREVLPGVPFSLHWLLCSGSLER